jgi:hypothetical protein
VVVIATPLAGTRPRPATRLTRQMSGFESLRAHPAPYGPRCPRRKQLGAAGLGRPRRDWLDHWGS